MKLLNMEGYCNFWVNLGKKTVFALIIEAFFIFSLPNHFLKREEGVP